MKALGIDFGLARVGWALSDEGFERVVATGYWDNTPQLMKAIAARVDEEHIEILVVGRPVSLLLHDTAFTDVVDRFLRTIAKELPMVSVIPWEERLSSHEAAGLLHASRPGKKTKEKGEIDAMAARLILQSFLDQRRQTTS